MTAPPTAPLTPPRAVRFLDSFLEVLLYALLAFLPAAYGTVDAWSERIATGIAAAMAACLAIRLLLVPARLDGVAVTAVALYLALAAFALVPLPRGIVQAISPATVQTRVDLLGDLPDADAALRSMPLSFYPLATRHGLRIVLLAVTVLATVMTVFREPGRMRRLLAAIALIGLATAGLALAQDVSGTRSIYWTTNIGMPARSGPFVNHSHFGQFLNLSIGAALALMLSLPRERRWRHVIWLAPTIVLGMVTISLSLTRGGVVAMLAAGFVTFLIALTHRNLLRRVGGIVGAFALAALIALLWFGFDRVYERMGDRGGMTSRLLMVRDTTEIIRKFPLMGTGLGTFEWVYPGYNHTNSASTASYLENEYVQCASETGFAGLTVVIAFVGLVAFRYARGLSRGNIAVIGLGYGLIAVMVHSLSDYGQHLPAVGCLAATVCGLIINLGRNDDADMERRSSILPRISMALIIAVIAGWAIREAEQAHRAQSYWKSAQQLSDDSTPEYGQLLLASTTAQPDNVHRRYWSAVHDWRTSDRTPADANRIIAALNAARKLCPVYAPLYAILGQIEFDTLEHAIGVTHIHTAARLDANDPTICFLSGRVDAQRGKWAQAEQMLRRAVDLDYTIMQDVIDLALNDLHKPELAMRVAEPNSGRMRMLLNAMLVLPEYASYTTAVNDRAVDLLDQECQQPGVAPYKLAGLAFSRAAQRRYAEAEKHYARALAADSTNVAWRLGRADALAGMGRFNEAIAETRATLLLHPTSIEAQRQLDRLTKPTPR